MEDERKVTLRELHGFYAEEARHQRSMMWETAKWFILILGVVFGATFTGILNQYGPNSAVPAWILLIPRVIGYIISLTCITLISSFYKTNLISLSTFIKIEDELGFGGRTTFSSFGNDKFITWQGYRVRREQTACSQDFIQNNLKYSLRRMHTLISFVFALFAIAFVVLTFPILTKANILDGWIVILTVAIYSLLFLFACLVLREIRKIK
jgi:undecaprenyl pyrophosphate phosphatase UppP